MSKIALVEVNEDLKLWKILESFDLIQIKKKKYFLLIFYIKKIIRLMIIKLKLNSNNFL